jgi:hypothetical protein
VIDLHKPVGAIGRFWRHLRSVFTTRAAIGTPPRNGYPGHRAVLIAVPGEARYTSIDTCMESFRVRAGAIEIQYRVRLRQPVTRL